MLFILVLGACTSTANTTHSTTAYQSVWAQLYPQTLAKKPTPDTLQGAFHRAAASTSRIKAEQRWGNFLNTWRPANGEYEDSMQAHLVQWAELELRRTQHLGENPPTAQAAEAELRHLGSALQ